MGSFKAVSAQRAQEIKEAIRQSQASGKGLTVDRETGSCVGASTLTAAEDQQSKLNAIGKFRTHYVKV